jgi:hypothetical protein
MATTTNFGWETPDDTDLVKDGALAIRTLGSAIDTSLVDLKGGTTGQVLSKTSNTDMDFTWVTTDDADAIQNSIVDAKADLITATAADTPARLAVGADYGFLTALASESTGLKWDAGAWTTYTPTVSSSTGTITTASATGKWKRAGKLIAVQQTITITTNGTGAGNLRATLPFDAESTDFVGAGRETAVTGSMLQIQTSGNLVIYRTTANAYPGGDGRTIIGTIVYEVD